MPAPRRLRATFGDTTISAFVMPMQQEIDDFHPYCKLCLSGPPTMVAIGEVTQYGFSDDLIYLVYKCKHCRRQWAWPFTVAHPIEDVSQ